MSTDKNSSPLTILVVDDEKNMRLLLSDLLEQEGYRIKSASNGLSAQKILEEEPVSAMISDLKMPGMDGLALLDWLNKSGPDIPVLMISAFGEVEDAVNAMKKGAADYLIKPFNPDELLLRLKNGLNRFYQHRIITGTHTRTQGDMTNPTADPVMKDLEKLIQKAAPTPSTILITGESGTGKEVTARRIHELSPRSEAPFLAINLGGIPETLLESELFGYEKGAFTGADRRKPGQIELATGGTLFLDEIGDMPLPLQVKILRVLQERKIQRLGGSGPVPVDVRIVAATNRDLENMVKEGTFREDLFYRLNVIRIPLPPLRDRPSELPYLTDLFLKRYNRRINKNISGIRADALALLQNYSFPGNIRELENIMERAVILCDSDHITPEDLLLPSEQLPEAPPDEKTGGGTLQDMERQLIQTTLLRNEGRKQLSADELGISRRTLLNKIKEYNL